MEGFVVQMSTAEATELLTFCCSDLKTFESIDTATGPTDAFTPSVGFQQPGGGDGEGHDAAGGLMSFVRLLPRDMQTHLDGLTGFVGSVRDAVVNLSVPSPPRAAVRSGPLAAGAGASGSGAPLQQLAAVQPAGTAAGVRGELTSQYNQAKLQECKGLPCPTALNTIICLGSGNSPLLICTPSAFIKVAQLLPPAISSSLMHSNTVAALGEHLSSSDFTSMLDLRRFNLHDLSAKIKELFPATWYVAPRPIPAVANQRARGVSSRVLGSGEVGFSAGCPSLMGVLWKNNGTKEGPARGWLENIWLLVQELRQEEDEIAAAAAAMAAAAAQAAASTPAPLAPPPLPPPAQNAPAAAGPPRVANPAAVAAEVEEQDDTLIALEGWPMLPTVGTHGRLLHVAARKAILAVPNVQINGCDGVSTPGGPVGAQAGVESPADASIPKVEDNFDFEALVRQ